VREIHTIFN